MSLKTTFAFFGTPLPAVEILEHLEKSGLVPAVIITNPDKPQGRSLALTPSPVKAWALERKIPILEPEHLDEYFEKELKKSPWDLFVVVAYGKIIPKSILSIPQHGSLNVHYSLLPKYRGASPIESQILADDPNPGISIMLLDEKMDHGPVLSHAPVVPSKWPAKAEDLREASNNVAGNLLADLIPKWIEKKIKPTEQDHTKATYTKKLSKADGLIDLADIPRKNYLKFLAFHAWPGTYFFVEKDAKKIRVLVKDADFQNETFVIKRVIPEGKKEMNYDDFLRGTKN